MSERMGLVPPDMPMVPLQKDLHRLQQKLRLAPEIKEKNYQLDLRKDRDLARSHLLHRLRLLGVAWGESSKVRGKGGSYRELWMLLWKPELAIKVIEASRWGNTVSEAATACAVDIAAKAENLDALSQLLDAVVLADLPEVIPELMQRVADVSATTSDISKMMKALAPLVRIMRYGSVRNTDEGMLKSVIDSMLKRICIGLAPSTQNIKDDLAAELKSLIEQTHTIVSTLNEDEHKASWQASLQTIAQQENTHGLLAGRTYRLLLNSRVITKEAAKEALAQSLFLEPIASKSSEELMQTAFWIEGFLTGSALSLLHDDDLWKLLDEWLNEVQEGQFLDILPLLRRTFANFSQASRQQLQDRARNHARKALSLDANFNHEQAKQVLPIIALLLGQDDVAAPFEAAQESVSHA